MVAGEAEVLAQLDCMLQHMTHDLRHASALPGKPCLCLVKMKVRSDTRLIQS